MTVEALQACRADRQRGESHPMQSLGIVEASQPTTGRVCVDASPGSTAQTGLRTLEDIRRPVAIQADTVSAAPFAVLLRDSLNVSAQDELLVLFDSTLDPFWDALLAAVLDNGCGCTFINLPIALQRTLSRRTKGDSEVELPTGLCAAIDEVDAIITILTGDINLASVRRALVSKAIGMARRDKRLAHIPGLSSEILHVLTRSPISRIEEECEAFAWVLGEGRDGSLITTDSAGCEHTLTVDLGGWLNEPLMSPGVIYQNSWGNVPPGETFCCPAPCGVTGSVAINGSIPNQVCDDGEDIVLEFECGRLTRWTSRCDRLRDFFDRQLLLAAERHDESWNTFAELGIGLNPAITNLTGNSLLDEKARGTIHIAIGDNFGFGHSIKSHIHADLVMRQPSLRIDDRLVIDRGVPQLATIAAWRDGLETRAVEPGSLRKLQVRHEKFETRPRRADAFARRLHSRGRTGYVTIAVDDDAAALGRIYDALTADDPLTPDGLSTIAERTGLPRNTAARLLGLLVHYQMLYVEPDLLTEGAHANL